MQMLTRKNLIVAILSVTLAILAASCAAVPPAPAEPGPSEPVSADQPAQPDLSLTMEVLKNTEYQSEWTQSGTAPLENGEYREQAAPGSATETVVMLTDHVAFGELNGMPVAAVVLVTDPGGSGTFRDLAVVVNQDGEAVNIATTNLGDRVEINSVAIENDQIIVDMVTQGPEDPMCCPTQQEVRAYELQDDQLVLASSEVIGTVEAEGAESEIVTLYVGPEKVECVGVAPQECLLVKENPEDDYTLFYSNIQGFEFEEGYEYELLVQVDKVENPPADASSLSYTLIEVVDKQPVADMGTSASLEGTLWQLETYVNAEGETVSVLPDSRITLELLEGQVAGNDGCNNYFGTYVLSENSLEIMVAGGTMMACPQEIMDQASAYQAAIAEVATFEIAGSQLSLVNADGEVVLIFVEDQPTSLTGTEWQLISYYNGSGLVTSIASELINATFSEDGVMSGFAGCNNYTASYVVDGDSMEIGPAAATRMMCAEPEDVMETESTYLAVLETVVRFELEGDELTLFNAEGIRAAWYRAVVQTPELSRPPLPFDADAAAESGLLDTVWLWQSFSDPAGTAFDVDQPDRYQLEFQPDGTVRIQADCNAGGGLYAVEGQGLWISIQHLTMAMCDPESLSDQYIAYLDAAASYVLDGDNLIINLMVDSGDMVFAP